MLEPSSGTGLFQLMTALWPGCISCKYLLHVIVAWTNLFSLETGKFDLGESLQMSQVMVAADLQYPPAHTRQGGALRASWGRELRGGTGARRTWRCHELSRAETQPDWEITRGDGHIYSNKLLWHGPGRDGGFFIRNDLARTVTSIGYLGFFHNIIGHQVTGCGN